MHGRLFLRLAEDLRKRSGLADGGELALVEGGRVLTSSAPIRGTLGTPSRPAEVEVSGRRPVVTNALRRIDGRWRLLPTPDPTG